MVEASLAMRQLSELERHLGKGQTFTPKEQASVLKHGAPAWLVMGSKFGKGELSDRCDKAIAHLSGLYDQVQLALPEPLRTKRGDG